MTITVFTSFSHENEPLRMRPAAVNVRRAFCRSHAPDGSELSCEMSCYVDIRQNLKFRSPHSLIQLFPFTSKQEEDPSKTRKTLKDAAEESLDHFLKLCSQSKNAVTTVDGIEVCFWDATECGQRSRCRGVDDRLSSCVMSDVPFSPSTRNGRDCYDSCLVDTLR